VLRRPVGAGALASAVWGKFAVQRAVRDLAIDVVMPRSTLPALACMLAVRPPSPIRFVFDGDGLPHDEWVDFAGWSASGLSYRILRDLESQAVRRADAVITRTLAGRDVLMARAGAGTSAAKFHVIGNGRDEKLFQPQDAADRAILRRSLGIDPAALVLVYSGSIGDQYCLAEMRSIFEKVRSARPDTCLLFLTGSPDTARKELGTGTDAGAVIVRRIDAAEVPQFLGAADVALCLRRPTFSTRAVSPIKLGEYLLCGLPVVLSRGTGDVDQLPGSDALCFMEGLNEQALTAAAAWIAGADHAALRTEARDIGVAHFALSATVQGYKGALA
jgi:glycosyltransferase involved in cell wall biosynthesis